MMKTLSTWQDRFGDIIQTVLLVVVIFDSFLVYATYKSAQAVARNMQNTVIEEQVFSDLKDAECGQRGFLYTDGDEDYLPQYYVGVATTKADMVVLAQYLKSQPDSGPVVAQLGKEIDVKLQELDATVRAFRSGHAERAKEIVKSGTGMRDMERIRTLIGVLRAQERASLRQQRLFF